MTTDTGTQADRVDALVIFGATGDLAKLETFPALVGLVDRGVLDVPVIGVAKSGWGLEQFRDYAVNSLKLNKMDPKSPAAVKMLGLLRYVDGDLGDPATYKAMSDAVGQGSSVLFYMEVPPSLFGRIAQGISEAGRAGHARIMVEKPFGHDLKSSEELNQTMHKFYPEDAIYRVDDWLGFDPVRTCCSPASPTLSSSRCSTALTCTASRSRWRKNSASTTAAASTTEPVPSGTSCRTTCSRSLRASWLTRQRARA